MNKLFLVGLGGFVGAVLRHLICESVRPWSDRANFPFGTLLVNMLGCIVLGLLTQIAEDRNVLSCEMRLLIFIGTLGAFTTFATFSSETLFLLRNGNNIPAFINVTAHLAGGLAMLQFGRALVRII